MSQFSQLIIGFIATYSCSYYVKGSDSIELEVKIHAHIQVLLFTFVFTLNFDCLLAAIFRLILPSLQCELLARICSFMSESAKSLIYEHYAPKKRSYFAKRKRRPANPLRYFNTHSCEV